jgi:hypothetical protein
MHDLDRTLRTLESEDAFETGDTELDPEIFESEVYGAEVYGGYQQEGPLSEEEELNLAYELLGLAGEEELDQFLGKVFKKIGKGFKTVFRPLGKILKPLAKTLLPIAGKAVGGFFGGPLGGAVGGKLGSLATKLFEVDFESMDPEVQDLEVARRFVRLASTAAQKAAAAPPTAHPVAAARSAVAAAARTHAPGLLKGGAGLAPTASSAPAARPCSCGGQGSHQGPSQGSSQNNGRWIRRGRKVVLLGV